MKARDKSGEIFDTDIKIHKKTGLYYRLNTSDKDMLNDCVNNYNFDIKKNDRVLDLGANIGGFSLIAAKQGAIVYSVEACSLNYEMLKKNTFEFKDKIELLHGAVVSDSYDKDTISFYLKKSNNNACSGTIASNGKNSSWFVSENIKAYKISYLLEKFEPNIVKMDIEGGEYGIIEMKWPKSVSILACELHGMNKLDESSMYNAIDILKKDWNVIYEKPEIIFGKVRLMNLVLERK